MSNSNTSETEKVGAFFESYAGSFDSIYGHEAKRTVMEKITDKLFRQTMFVRFKETLKHTANPKIKSIIDIGCGPGHYCAAFLHQNKKVTGLDLSQEMLNIARKHIESEKLKGEINFVHDDYVAHQFDSKFDAACLMGFFDYIKEPKNLLLKLKKDIKQEFYGSFPKSGGLLAVQRRIRYKIRNCPLYLYSKQDVESLMKEAGFNNYEIMSCKRDWFVRVKL